MIVIKTSVQLLEVIQKIKATQKTLAFVPTMGNLHQGHLNLIDIARKNADIVIVSIFVNPLQFNEQQDLIQYPRTINEDLIQCKEYQTDYVFVPSIDDIYQDGEQSKTTELAGLSAISSILEGQSRPDHFAGVITVVQKLFNLIPADVVVFGEKDYQQLLIIKQMIKILNLPIVMVAAEITRETDGLAMSSRNSKLSIPERKLAPKLFETLQMVANKIQSGHNDFSALSHEALIILTDLGFKPDYFEIRNSEDLSQANQQKDIIILLAVNLGNTRLIDNISLSH